MTHNTLDRLLATLDVQVHAFAALEIAAGTRLMFAPMNLIVVHHVLRGRGTLEVGGASRAPIAQGSIAIIPPGRPQALVAGEEAVRDVVAEENCSMLVDALLRFDAADGGTGDLRVMCATVTASYSGSFGLFDSLAGPILDDVSDLAPVRSAYETLEAERNAPDIGTQALTAALMKQCLILLIRRHLHRGSASSPFFASLADTRLGSAITLILEKPGAQLSLAELAAAAGMSRTAFTRAFADAFGQTPMDFVQKTRLHRAAQLLAFTQLPVKVVAASVGFASRSHFSHAFRRAYNADPTAYRKHHSRNEIALPANSGRSWLEKMRKSDED
jgi:AraC-like DNA-binding protein